MATLPSYKRNRLGSARLMRTIVPLNYCLLRRLGLEPNHFQVQRACRLLLDKGFYTDGGINFFRSLKHSETCVTGMVLSILAYFNLQKKRRPDGPWVLQNKHPGRTFFEMEAVGQPSRWNTLRALRILQWCE